MGMALRARLAALRRPRRRAEKQVKMLVNVEQQVVACLFVLDYRRSAASRLQHGRHHADAKPGRTVPALDEDGPTLGGGCGALGLVQAAGYF